MKRPSPSLAVSLVALVVALGGAGIAETGGNFILGRNNSADERTALNSKRSGSALLVRNESSTAGATALRLETDPGQPPMSVASKVRVASLNADMVDGKHARDFASAKSEGWHYIDATGGSTGEPQFENGWSNLEAGPGGPFQRAAYRIDQNGIVHLTGLIRGGTIDQIAFTLQGKYCPFFQKPFLVLSDDGTARPSSVIGRVDITFGIIPDTCGVRITEGISEQFVSLTGISYPTIAIDERTAVPPALADASAGDAASQRRSASRRQ